MNPAMATISMISVLSKASHPNAGKLLAEFVASEEGQRIARDHDYIPVNPLVEASDPALRPDGVRFRAITFSPDQIETGIPKWHKIFTDLFR